MKAFDKLIEEIENKLFEVGVDNIDYSSHIDDRFNYNCASYIESKNNIIYFTFDAYDCCSGFNVSNIVFEDNYMLKNIIDKLKETTFRYES